MNKYSIVLLALLLGACATTDEEEDDAVADFIAVNELEELDVIRSYDQLGQFVLSDDYVIVTTSREQYLLAYVLPCRTFGYSMQAPDIRTDPRAIFAKSDTFRGCRIKSFYRLSEEQAEELKDMGRAPGER